MNKIAYLSLSFILVLSSCGMFQNSGKLSFRKVEQEPKEVKTKQPVSAIEEHNLTQLGTVQSEQEETLRAHTADKKNAEPKAIKRPSAKKLVAQQLSADFKPVKQVIHQGKKVKEKLTPHPMDSGVKKAIFFLIAAILLALLGAVFYYNLGVFGMILGIIFYIGAAVYFVVAIFMLIAG